MVEIVIENQVLYCQAELPPFDLQDAKLMKIEKDYKTHRDPESLLKALPRIEPFDQKILFTPAVNMKGNLIPGHWKFNQDMLKGIPKLDWSQFYNLKSVPQKNASK